MTPSEREERICEMFDSFCKRVIKNASINLRRDANVVATHESTDDAAQRLLESAACEDRYPSEHLTIYVGEIPCDIENDDLFNLLQSLPSKQRDVLLLGFSAGWTDKEIARRLDVTPRTVYNLRQKAFSKIREFYEKSGRDP